MNDLTNISFEKLSLIYEKYFSLGYLNTDVSNKLALISLTCYVTNEVRKKGKNMNCYDILLQIGKDMPESVKDTFIKSLGAICQSFMYECNTFPDFNIKPKDMPKTIKNLLAEYIPF